MLPFSVRVRVVRQELAATPASPKRNIAGLTTFSTIRRARRQAGM